MLSVILLQDDGSRRQSKIDTFLVRDATFNATWPRLVSDLRRAPTGRRIGRRHWRCGLRRKTNPIAG